MLRIRLSRHGAKKDPHYRVVVADKRSPRDGRFIEVVGYYNPALKPVRLNLDLERVDHWVNRGARPSDTVLSLIQRVRGAETEASQEPEPKKDSQETETKEDTEVLKNEVDLSG